MLAPELIDEALRRDRLVGVQEQDREQRSLIPSAERNGLLPVEHLEGAEDPELEHFALVVTGFARHR